MVIFIDMFFAFAAAFLTGLGIGSGGLLIIYLTLVKNYEQIPAQALNLVFFMSAAFISLFVNISKKNIYFLPALILIAFGIFGAFFGSITATYIGGNITKKIFGILMLFLGIYGLFFQKKD